MKWHTGKLERQKHKQTYFRAERRPNSFIVRWTEKVTWAERDYTAQRPYRLCRKPVDCSWLLGPILKKVPEDRENWNNSMWRKLCTDQGILYTWRKQQSWSRWDASMLKAICFCFEFAFVWAHNKCVQSGLVLLSIGFLIISNIQFTFLLSLTRHVPGSPVTSLSSLSHTEIVTSEFTTIRVKLGLQPFAGKAK